VGVTRFFASKDSPRLAASVASKTDELLNKCRDVSSYSDGRPGNVIGGTVTGGTLALGTVTCGIETLGTDTFGTETRGTLTLGTLTPGTVTRGVDTPGRDTLGTLPSGTLDEDPEEVGIVTGVVTGNGDVVETVGSPNPTSTRSVSAPARIWERSLKSRVSISPINC
jgi:hypothetical protein